MHCESGDVLVRDVVLDDPRPGDVLVTPATGAYGHAMASNYNAVPRPPVVFCSGGRARVVVRRETYADLADRDVLDGR
jgi:diaminopimelate decarboxylase